MEKKELQNIQGTFTLPPDVSFRKERLTEGWSYVFRHTQLGTLGRIVLQQRPDGRTHMTCEVVGDPNDPMTSKRADIFKPLGLELAHQLFTPPEAQGKINGLTLRHGRQNHWKKSPAN